MKRKKSHDESPHLWDVYKEYADALGKEVKELNDTEKRLALKDLALEVVDKVKYSR